MKVFGAKRNVIKRLGQTNNTRKQVKQCLSRRRRRNKIYKYNNTQKRRTRGGDKFYKPMIVNDIVTNVLDGPPIVGNMKVYV